MPDQVGPPDTQQQIESPDKLDLEGVQKSYFEATSRANRFLVSTFIILGILIIVAGQELREYSKKQSELARSIKKTVRRLRVLDKKLNEKYSRIGEVRRRAGLDDRYVPKAAGRIEYPRDIETMGKGEQDLQTQIDELAKGITAAKEKIRAKAKEETGAKAKEGELRNRDFDAKRSGVRLNENSMRFATAQAPISGTVIDDTSNRSSQGGDEGSERYENLDQALAVTRSYKEMYHDRVGLAQRLFNKNNEARALNSSKKSIPTPFGSFEVAPRLALLGLSFAVFFSYFAFHVSTQRIRGMAEEYSRASKHDNSIAARTSEPFWLYRTGSGSDRFSISDPRYLKALTLHVFWLAIAGWLVLECVFRWKAAKAVAFDYGWSLSYILVLCLIVSVVLAVWEFAPPTFKQRFPTLPAQETEQRPALSRRSFLTLGTLAALGAVAGSLVHLLNRQAKTTSKQECRSLSTLVSKTQLAQWVVHQKSNVAHHKIVCRLHLPSKEHQHQIDSIDESATPPCIHLSYAVRILEDIAETTLIGSEDSEDTASTNKDRETAISLFKDAIALSPLSHHLYDKLVSIYIKSRRYQEIEPLLQNGLKEVETRVEQIKNTGAKTQTSKKLRKKLQRSQEGFELRIRQTRYRKAQAEERRAKKAKTDNQQKSEREQKTRN